MDTMHITIDIFTHEFRWLWLKYVTGFDERHHCKPCLKGNDSRSFRYNRDLTPIPAHFSFALDEFRAPFIYLCGVAAHYEDNLHIAIKHAQGGSIHFEDQRIRVSIINAIQLPILPVDATKPAEFLRCRNFQFGYRYLRNTSVDQLSLFSDP